MRRYIDAELAKETIRECLKTEAPMPRICKKVMDIAIGAVDLTPSADAVEVVRCKDCKHLEIINSKEIYARCRMTDLEFKPFDIDARKHYCSYGKRREK